MKIIFLIASNIGITNKINLEIKTLTVRIFLNNKVKFDLHLSYSLEISNLLNGEKLVDLRSTNYNPPLFLLLPRIVLRIDRISKHL